MSSFIKGLGDKGVTKKKKERSRKHNLSNFDGDLI
jgi:hypothetical protein